MTFGLTNYRDFGGGADVQELRQMGRTLEAILHRVDKQLMEAQRAASEKEVVIDRAASAIGDALEDISQALQQAESTAGNKMERLQKSMDSLTTAMEGLTPWLKAVIASRNLPGQKEGV